MTISLKVWTSPKTQEVRVYATPFHEYGEMACLGGAYFVADEDGKIKVGGFKSSWSGDYGRAAHALFFAYMFDRLTFSRLLELIAECKTSKGNFSESRYFARLRCDGVVDPTKLYPALYA